MIPGMNPRKMKQMMKQLGMDIKPIEDVQEIVITTASGRYVFDQAEVAVMKMQGVVTWQITGEPRFEEAVAVIPDEDVELVAGQAGVSAEAAKAALVETKGDIAEAILRLSS
ncbi:MAG TPA: nascent polypeptide-associated complex protein [Methanospirillum sp.]|jgi:nascent polypeptide-associated complex subunit alpha|uniref:nascent polypeptide-associated complex protein n=1 Tax=Methanospirillum sp. TaxID=45200 RepID=UPI002BAA4A98|nr:nascent polypeptide-associated complex protein [Methanospirillum sp.]HPY59906.1 nascent polypeptide-associated complex protein [Methanospirillum sp.]